MGIVPPSLIPFWRREAQPKDERPPLQGYGDQLEGWSGEETQGGQSNRALLKLMKSVEERIVPSDPPQGGSVIARAPHSNPSIITEYGGKPPRPRVDPDLIGDYYI